ncbi:MAG: ABC transporter permease [Armatimonadetes bacterium]|nr:ABC transporter permease [Armatimonadota bacterium]
MTERAQAVREEGEGRPVARKRPGPRERFLRNRRAIAGAVILVAFVAMSLFAPAVAPYRSDEQNFLDRLAPPGARHVMGADHLGRDVFSRTVWAGRVSLSIGLLSTLLTMLLGVTAGTAAGYFGGWTDTLLMRLVDMILAVPLFFLAVAFLALYGPSIPGLIFILGAASWPPSARLVRAEFLRLKVADFVTAARALGARDLAIIVRHILPNVVPVIVISATLRVGIAILAEAGLSYLGLGVQPPTPSWGNIVADGRVYLRTAWWVSLFPGAFVLLSVMAVNLVGDGLRDAFDPRMRV